MKCSDFQERGFQGPLDDRDVSLFHLSSSKICEIHNAAGKLLSRANCENLNQFIRLDSAPCQRLANDPPAFGYFPDQAKPMLLCRDYSQPDWSQREALRFFVMGDIGVGENASAGEHQARVAQAMSSVCPPSVGVAGEAADVAAGVKYCDFALVVGDLIYPHGIFSVWDGQTQSKFEDIYAAFGAMPFYMLPGNHDYQGSIYAEIEYTYFSERWRMLDRYYSVPGLPAWLNLTTLDTQGIVGEYDSPATWGDQLAFLRQGFCQQDGWRLLSGHYPAFSSGFHGSAEVMNRVLRELGEECPFDIYLAGHDHHLEHVQGTSYDQFVLGGGGARVKDAADENPYDLKEPLAGQKYAASAHGFAVFEVSEQSVDVYVFNLARWEYSGSGFGKEPSFSDFAYHCRITEQGSRCEKQQP